MDLYRFRTLSERRSAWEWQGKRAPIREWRDENGVLMLDAKCFRCGWQRTSPFLAFRVKAS